MSMVHCAVLYLTASEISSFFFFFFWGGGGAGGGVFFGSVILDMISKLRIIAAVLYIRFICIFNPCSPADQDRCVSETQG